MPGLVLLAGVLITGASLFLMVRPGAMAGVLDRVFGSNLLYGAALLRILLGAALIASADSVRCAAGVELFGWLFALSGLTLVAVPRPAILRLAGWFGGLPAAAARAWLSGALLFGLFFIYAALP